MNMNTKNTKMSVSFLLILSSLALTGCNEAVKTEEPKVKISGVGQAQEADRSVKARKIQAVYANKEGQISELKAQLEKDKTAFIQEIESELAAQQAFLNSKNQDEIQKLNTQAEQDQTAVIISIEREIAALESKTESELVKKLLDDEIKNVSDLVKEDMKLQETRKKEIANAKVKINRLEQKKLAELEKNIANAKKYNQDLLNLKAAELRRMRIEIAMSAEQKAIAKNHAVLDNLQSKYDAELAKRIAAVKEALDNNRKTVLGALNNKFDTIEINIKNANEKRQQNLGVINAKIKKEVGDKKRDSLKLVRKAKITSIQTDLKTNIAKSITNKKEALASFKVNLDAKLFDNIESLEKVSLQKSQDIYKQAEKAEQRIIDEYNEKKRITAQILLEEQSHLIKLHSQ